MSADGGKTMPAVPARRSLRNVLSGVLIGYGAETFLWFFFAHIRWSNAAPMAPDLTRGLHQPLNVHGTVVYLSDFQATALTLMALTSFPLVVLGALVMPKTDIEWRLLALHWDVDDPHGHFFASLGIALLATLPFLKFAGPPLVHFLNAHGIVWSLL